MTLVDTIPGIVAPGLMTILVIIVAAAVLGQTGEEARTVNQLAAVFEPLAGPVGSAIFALGLAGAAFSSMIANATAGGTTLSDALGRGASSGSRTAKIVSAVILLWGIGVTLTFQASPVQLIIMAQALTVLVAPPAGRTPHHHEQPLPLHGRPAQHVVEERLRRHRLHRDPGDVGAAGDVVGELSCNLFRGKASRGPERQALALASRSR